jgi:hypothetical protein
MDQVVLMIGLRRIEALERFDARDDRLAEGMLRAELGDIGARDVLLSRARIEDFRAIARAAIGTCRFNCVGS